LPRYSISLRKHRPQALVPLNNVPKRSFQRANIDITTQPNRKRDRVPRTTTFQTAPKTTADAAQTTTALPQDNNGRSGARASPTPPSRSTSNATVGASNRLRIDTSTSRLDRSRLIRRVARSE
jgi:hypothetical protein